MRPEREFMSRTSTKVLVVPEGESLNVLSMCSFFLKRKNDNKGDFS